MDNTDNTVNPQLENGGTSISNELLEAIYNTNFNKYESRVLWFIIRKTYGFHKKMDVISLVQFEQGNGNGNFWIKGTSIERSNVCHILNRLIERNIIIKNKVNAHSTEYGINKHYNEWDSVQVDSVQVDTVGLDSVQVDSVQLNNEQCSTEQRDSVQVDNEQCSVEHSQIVITNNNTNNNTNSSRGKSTTAIISVIELKQYFYSLKNKDIFKDVNFDEEWDKFDLQINGKIPDNPQLACYHWLERAVQYGMEHQGNGDNGDGYWDKPIRYSKGNPWVKDNSLKVAHTYTENEMKQIESIEQG